jgi:SAM-dependent methyltransferase
MFLIQVPPDYLDSHNPIPEREYLYYRCGDCSAAFLSPLPSDAEHRTYYEADTYHYDSDSSPRELSAFRRWHLNVSRKIPVKRAGDHLDFGCGPGYYMAYARSLGWKSTGVEYSEKGARAARDRGFPVVLESELATLPDGSFDLVTMIHSLEHLPDPGETLSLLARKLRPGGVLMVEVPYLDCHEFGLFGRNYSMIQAPVHLQFFTDETMRYLAARAGLELTHQCNNTLTPVHYVWSMLNWLHHRLGFALSRRCKNTLNILAFPLVVIPAGIASQCGLKGVARQYYFQA